MKHQIQNRKHSPGPTISLICPICGHEGVLKNLGIDDFYDSSEGLCFGQRMCMNPKCNGHLFTICERSGEVIQTYPPIEIPFNPELIPEKIKETFEEAIICHSNNCFIASAIMIRKTLEVLCEDRGAKGKTLVDRIKELADKIVIPKELKDGLDDLRLLGNDAAHVEARTYEEIGKEEIEISIEFTKEILKATYQYEGFLKRLQGLKSNSTDT